MKFQKNLFGSIDVVQTKRSYKLKKKTAETTSTEKRLHAMATKREYVKLQQSYSSAAESGNEKSNTCDFEESIFNRRQIAN